MSKQAKRLFLRAFFVLEVIVLLIFYFFGPHGLPMWMQLKRENSALEKEIGIITSDIEALKKTLVEQETDFFKEKIARDKLQMIKPGDTVYYLPKSKESS